MRELRELESRMDMLYLLYEAWTSELVHLSIATSIQGYTMYKAGS